MPMCMNYTIAMNIRMLTYMNWLWSIVCDIEMPMIENAKRDICEKHANESVMRL